MRRALRARLRGDPEDAATRARVYALIHVKHPGYTPEDLDRARELVLQDISG